MNKKPSIHVDASLVLLASISCVVIGMGTNIVTARALGPEMKGRLDLFNSTVALAVTCIGFSLASGVTYVVAQGHVHLGRLINLITVTSFAQGVAILLSLLLLRWLGILDGFVPAAYADWGPLAIAVAAVVVLLGNCARACFAGSRRFGLAACYDVTARGSAAGGLVLGVVWFYPQLERATAAAIMGSLLTPAVIVMASLLILRRPAPKPGWTSKFGVVWRYSVPCFLANLVQFLNYRLDVFVIAYFLRDKNAAELAWYTTAASIAQLLWLPPQAMQNVLFPSLTSITDDAQRAETAARAMRFCLALTVAMGSVLAVAGPWVISLLFSHRFDGSVRPLRLLLPGVVVFSVATVLASHLGAIGKPRLNLVASLVGLVPTVFLLFWLVPWIGIAGAAIASSVAYTVTALMILAFFCAETSLSLRDALMPKRSDVQLAWNLTVRMFQKAIGRLG